MGLMEDAITASEERHAAIEADKDRKGAKNSSKALKIVENILGVRGEVVNLPRISYYSVDDIVVKVDGTIYVMVAEDSAAPPGLEHYLFLARSYSYGPDRTVHWEKASSEKIRSLADLGDMLRAQRDD